MSNKINASPNYLWSFKKIEKEGRKEEGEERKNIKKGTLYTEINEKTISLGSRYPETTFPVSYHSPHSIVLLLYH